MTNQVQKFDLKTEIYTLEGKFNELAVDGVKFQQEALFAMQAIEASQHLKGAAISNKFKLHSAILNIATIGLSLNPALKLAYLVPRAVKKGAPPSVNLDISYMGLVKLATDSGSIRWAQAEIVRKNDKFTYRGPGFQAIHEMENPFSQEQRGEIVGVYATAKTSDGDFLVTIMSKQEIDAIMLRSKASSGPWQSDYEEMAKKTVIKRASKLWPKSERLVQAVDVINEHEGIDFEEEIKPQAPQIDYDQKNKIVESVSKLIQDATKDLTAQQKGEFLAKIKVRSLADLKRMGIEQLSELSNSLQAPKQITTNEIPFE